MGWLDELRGTLVALDSAPLIYYIEEYPAYLSIVDPFFDALNQSELAAVTSTVTLAEVLTHPLRRGDKPLAAKYRELLLSTDGLTTLPLTAAIAEEAAGLRASHGLRTPDAIQLATAVVANAAVFLTNDARLPLIATMPVLVLDKLASDLG